MSRGLPCGSCGWIWARNHQAQGCIGCHEDPELTPPNRVSDALKEESAMAAVPVERRITVDFAQEIAPVVSSKCACCHRGREAAADLDLAGESDEGSGRAAGEDRSPLPHPAGYGSGGRPGERSGKVRPSRTGSNQSTGLASSGTEHVPAVGQGAPRTESPGRFRQGK